MQVITKLNNKNYRVDLTAKRIDFLDNRFYYTEGSDDVAPEPVPSVTTILESYPKGAAFYEWLKKNGQDSDDIRDEAGRRGSVVHNLTERYDNGEPISLINEEGFVQFKMSEWAMFERYVEFRRRFHFNILMTEAVIVSKKLGFAGTLDRLIEWNGKNILLDIKTSAAIWPSYWLQLAAYEKLLTEQFGYNPVDEVAVLWLNAKTKTDGGKKKDVCQGKGWQMITRDDSQCDNDWNLFQATHKLWLAENGSMVPREISYQLSHQLTADDTQAF